MSPREPHARRLDWRATGATTYVAHPAGEAGPRLVLRRHRGGRPRFQLDVFGVLHRELRSEELATAQDEAEAIARRYLLDLAIELFDSPLLERAVEDLEQLDHPAEERPASVVPGSLRGARAKFAEMERQVDALVAARAQAARDREDS